MKVYNDCMTQKNDFKEIVNDNRPRKCLGAGFLPLIECGELVRAHSIQNNGVLDFISKGSQTILHRRFDASESRTCELILFEKIGRKVATIFANGMCGEHDKELFRCIEDEDFDPDNKKQLVTYAVRSLLKETYTKEHALGVSDTIFENNSNPLSLGYARAGNTLEKQKGLLRKIYIQEKRKYKDFETNVFVLDFPCKVACSSIISPWFGFKGEEINSQDINPDKQYVVYINIFPNNNKTYILFGTTKNDKGKFKSFFRYLKSLDKNSLKRALTAVLLCYCQNIVITNLILDDKVLVEKINRITNETQIGPSFHDLENPNYLKELMLRDINIFI